MEKKDLVYALQTHFKAQIPSDKLIERHLATFNGNPDWLRRDELNVVIDASTDLNDFFKRTEGMAGAYLGLTATK